MRLTRDQHDGVPRKRACRSEPSPRLKTLNCYLSVLTNFVVTVTFASAASVPGAVCAPAQSVTGAIVGCKRLLELHTTRPSFQVRELLGSPMPQMN